MSKASGPSAALVAMLWDVGLSVGAYYVAHWSGADDVTALITGSVVALLRLLYVVVRTRTVDMLAAVMFGVFAVGLGLSFLTGDARFLLAKDSIATGAAGLAFLVTCVVGRPLIYQAALRTKTGRPAEIARYEQLWATSAGFRRRLRLISVVWGVGLLTDAIVRLPIIYTMATTTAVTASTALFVATMGLLALWTAWYARRSAARQDAVAVSRP